MTTFKQPLCVHCEHYDIKKRLSDDHEGYFCQAYPDGIPEEILQSADKHFKKRDDQNNDLVFKMKY